MRAVIFIVVMIVNTSCSLEPPFVNQASPSSTYSRKVGAFLDEYVCIDSSIVLGGRKYIFKEVWRERIWYYNDWQEITYSKDFSRIYISVFPFDSAIVNARIQSSLLTGSGRLLGQDLISLTVDNRKTTDIDSLKIWLENQTSDSVIFYKKTR